MFTILLYIFYNTPFRIQHNKNIDTTNTAPSTEDPPNYEVTVKPVSRYRNICGY